MISLRQKAQRIAPGRFAVTYDGAPGESDLLALLDPSNWKIKRFDGVFSAWLDAAGGERLLAVYSEKAASELELRFCGLNGLYRLESDSSLAFVKKSASYFYLRETDSEREPYHLYLEGHGKIDYTYLDQDGLPSGISQKLDQKEGIAACGGLDFTLADYDGALASIFNPRSSEVVAVLAEDVQADSLRIPLEDASRLPQSGALWLDRELLEYSSIVDDALSVDVRGARRSRAACHKAGTRVRSVAPHLRGRAVYIEKADGTRLYGGVITGISPLAGNQACFRVCLSDALSALDVDIGRNLGRAAVAPLYMIQGSATRFRLRWLDALAIGGYKPSEYGALVSLRPGVYDITPGRGGARHLCDEIARAVSESDAISAERFVAAEINGDGELLLKLKGSYRVELLPTESACVLTQLGFPAEGLSVTDDEGWSDGGSNPDALFTMSAGVALEDCCLSAAAETILVMSGEGERVIDANGGLLRIDDELVAYSSMLRVQHAAIATLAADMSAGLDSDTLKLDDANGFMSGQIVSVDDEQIMLGEKWGDTFSECVRGAGGTAAAAHYAGAQVILPAVEMLLACRRGMYGSSAATHASGRIIEELLCSDDLRDARNPKPTPPLEFVAALLGCGGETHLERFSLELPPDMLNADGVLKSRAAEVCTDPASFLAIIGEGCSYRDALADVTLCLGAGLYVDSSARISAGSFAARLEHESGTRSISSGDWIGPPAVVWCEDGRINRVIVQLDRDPLDDGYARRLVLNDKVEDGVGLFRAGEHCFELKAPYFHSGESRIRSGSADTMFIGMARRCFAWFNRFYCAVEGRLPLAEFAGLGIFDGVRLTLPGAPYGDGGRGFYDAAFDVVEIEPDLSDMSLRVVLLERGEERYGGLNIAADVLSWRDGAKRLTIARSDYWPDGMEPAQLLKAGDMVRVMRRSGGSSVYSQAAGIVAVENSWRNVAGLYCADLTLADAPQPAPQLGDLLVSAPYGVHVLHDSVVRRLLHLADAAGHLGDDDAFVYSY